MMPETIRRVLERHRRRLIPVEQFPGYRKAAVLLLLFPKDGALSILLTVRTHLVETHKGQISCPGGMSDSGDVDAAATALRETEEELGIARNKIEILGLIDDMVTPTGFVITPVVGYMHESPVWQANPHEVAAVIDVPLAVFHERDTVRREERVIDMIGGGTITGTVWFFPYREHTIWGATAAMVVNLVDIIGDNVSGKAR